MKVDVTALSYAELLRLRDRYRALCAHHGAVALVYGDKLDAVLTELRGRPRPTATA